MRHLSLFVAALLAACGVVVEPGPLDTSLYEDLSDWETRRDEIRTGILDTLGMTLPYPTTALRVSRHGYTVLDDYTVENIALEVAPGLWIAGNLYAPLVIERPLPAVLNPHGHFVEDGWFPRTRPDMQARCAQLARMGAVAFTWDMFGYGEAQQLGHDDPEIARLVASTSLRVLDFIASLPEVDPARIAVTGASGGASQALLLAALDARVAASVPVVMVSAFTAGHCGCERYVPDWLETGNVEVAASAAPRPQLVVSIASDWTVGTPYLEMPFLRHIYGLHGAAAAVENVHLMTEGHDYGYPKRRAAYEFLARRLGLRLLDDDDPDADPPERITILGNDRLLVWDAEHPRPF